MAAGRMQFDHDERRQIYEYVERHGSVDPEDLQQAVMHTDPRGFRHHLAILKRNNTLTETTDGLLEVAIDSGEEEQHREADIAFTIRPAHEKDLSGIVSAIRRVAEQGRYIVAESVADEVDHQDVLLRHNELESRMFFVATVNDEVVGWVHIHAPELEKLSHTAELTVGVIVEYRCHGIGSHLLRRGLEWARAQGYEKVYQSLPSTNERAIEFLETHNWEIEAVREGHYRIDEEYVDEIMMSVSLHDDAFE